MLSILVAASMTNPTSTNCSTPAPKLAPKWQSGFRDQVKQRVVVDRAASAPRGNAELLPSLSPAWPGLPVPCRNDMAQAAQRHFYKKGVAVEVGVNFGFLSKIFLQRWGGNYFMVDAWRSFNFGYKGSSNHTQCKERCKQPCGLYEWQARGAASKCSPARRAAFEASCDARCNPHASEDVVNTAAMDATRQNTAFAGKRAQLVRKTSVEAAKGFAEASIDWLFIDGDHTYDGCLADLEAWYPKVRPGGLISGDDYGDGFNVRAAAHRMS